jgi:hypothetical protein
MVKPVFCFFHIGHGTDQPQMLVDSIRKFNPNAEIIYCTDIQSPKIDGVTHRLEFTGNPNEIMTFRLKSFADSKIEEPAIYLDTDMLCLKSFNPAKFLDNKDLCICERSFGKDHLFNANFRGLNYFEYTQKSFGEVYPYLACATITKNSTIWQELSNACNALSEKFRIWYGDQEALKIIAKTKSNNQLGFIPEHTFACLPEYQHYASQAIFLHFKGVARKKLMLEYYQLIMKS